MQSRQFSSMRLTVHSGIEGAVLGVDSPKRSLVKEKQLQGFRINLNLGLSSLSFELVSFYSKWVFFIKWLSSEL